MSTFKSKKRKLEAPVESEWVDFWLSLPKNISVQLSREMLQSMARSGVPLSRMEHAADIAKAIVDDGFGHTKVRCSSWFVLKALMDNDAVMQVVLDSGLGVAFTKWELRQLAARVQDKDKLLPAIKESGFWSELHTPLIMSLGLSSEAVASNLDKLVSLAVESKNDVLHAWLMSKMEDKSVDVSYVERYERCLLLSSESLQNEFKTLDEKDQTVIAQYVLWCNSLELVQLFWSDKTMTEELLVLAIQNPDPRVSYFAIKKMRDIDSETVVRGLIEQRDSKGAIRALKLLPSLDETALKECHKLAREFGAFEAELALNKLY